jgi:uncharacterized membrane protein
MDVPRIGQRNFLQRLWKSLIFLPAGLLLVGWLLITPPGLLGKADSIGYAVCHRIDLRSFHLGVRQLPLCARCTGMYLGAVLGLVYQEIIGRKRIGTPPLRVLIVLGSLVMAFIVDGLNSFLHIIPGFFFFYEPNNTLRLLSGTGMGLVISVALLMAFNQTVWQERENRPALTGFRSLLVLISIGVILDLLVMSENPLILYPLALISAAGVLIILTMVYTTVWLMVLRKENRWNHLVELILPLIGGFTLALIQIALLDFGRYLLTGTWQGFHLG